MMRLCTAVALWFLTEINMIIKGLVALDQGIFSPVLSLNLCGNNFLTRYLYVFSEHQREISSGFWSHCSSKLHWLWEEIQYGWAYMVCSYPWSRMGYFHTIRCEINEESLSRLRSHLCCTDNNFRGVYFALVFFLYKSISHAIVKLRCYLKYIFLWKKKLW